VGDGVECCGCCCDDMAAGFVCANACARDAELSIGVLCAEVEVRVGCKMRICDGAWLE
jgi:hypothetical protein